MPENKFKIASFSETGRCDLNKYNVAPFLRERLS